MPLESGKYKIALRSRDEDPDVLHYIGQSSPSAGIITILDADAVPPVWTLAGTNIDDIYTIKINGETPTVLSNGQLWAGSDGGQRTTWQIRANPEGGKGDYYIAVPDTQTRWTTHNGVLESGVPVFVLPRAPTHAQVPPRALAAFSVQCLGSGDFAPSATVSAFSDLSVDPEYCCTGIPPCCIFATFAPVTT
ncbi:hypothetical protein HYDPIDRAFT_190807 [Hydnomerulius pinastri MD-312]|uniref:Uncharacterized protein n=1 Tax=Hydnomerulius pinastri MD-312 TaxID=994086 RepID=A0A0C9UZJ4_9AGAM|nr:hypothetical protein HYDPIDRAFT_190807 [Hydnomerulius pinastri MD-312]